MACANSDADEHIDDVISRLDIAEMRDEEEKENWSKKKGEEDDEKHVPTEGDTPTKKSGTFVDNLKKLLPGGKSQDISGGSTSANDASNGSSSNRKDGGSKSSDRRKMLKEIKVEKLPQRFVCKYVGSKPCTGLWGVRHTRLPVDELIMELRMLKQGDDLPLVNVKVSGEGLKATLHCHSESTRPLLDTGLLPLQFISYAVQDPRYSKIFVFILVREMSSRERKTECHAYLCGSDVVARKMALAMALAFKEFSKKLEGKPHRFQVDLRDTDELETELTSKSSGAGSEFDA